MVNGEELHLLLPKVTLFWSVQGPWSKGVRWEPFQAGRPNDILTVYKYLFALANLGLLCVLFLRRCYDWKCLLALTLLPQQCFSDWRSSTEFRANGSQVLELGANSARAGAFLWLSAQVHCATIVGMRLCVWRLTGRQAGRQPEGRTHGQLDHV
jgi:hypothetical protein